MSLTPEFRNLRSLGGPSEIGRRVEAKNSDLVRTAVTTTRLVRISRRREDAVAVCRTRCRFFCSGSSQRVPRTTLGGNLPRSRTFKSSMIFGNLKKSFYSKMAVFGTALQPDGPVSVANECWAVLKCPPGAPTQKFQSTTRDPFSVKIRGPPPSPALSSNSGRGAATAD